MRWPRQTGALALALAALGLGCPEKKEPPPAEPSLEADAATPRPAAPSPRAGVKVPLPPGWTAQVAADGSFQAGPAGRPVLRVDIRPGQAKALPSPDALSDAIEKSFQAFALSFDQEEGEEDLSLVRATVAPKLGDGGVGPELPVLLGAKRMEGDLFLCATLPGASAEEVRLATEACRDIQVRAPPR